MKEVPVWNKNTRLRGVSLELLEKILLVFEELEKKGHQPVVAEGMRTESEQRVKVANGWSKTMNSDHLRGTAIDCVDKRYGWAGPCSKQTAPFWNDLGAACKIHGVKWGGNWRSFKDVAHCYI